MAERVCVSAKCSAPATCNAAECVLVHRDLSPEFVRRLVLVYADAGVEVRGSDRVLACFGGERPPNLRLAEPGDFGREFLDKIVAMEIVDSLDGAIEHIQRHSSNHTEAILTRDTDPGGAADEFCRRVQSSCVLVNASTRFNDGFQLGLGAEIGISTSRVHAYGVMGLEELTTQRWIVTGNGQTR
jgi:glutamate-5-semialdehyde dehydrogenase